MSGKKERSCFFMGDQFRKSKNPNDKNSAFSDDTIGIVVKDLPIPFTTIKRRSSLPHLVTLEPWIGSVFVFLDYQFLYAKKFGKIDTLLFEEIDRLFEEFEQLQSPSL